MGERGRVKVGVGDNAAVEVSEDVAEGVGVGVGVCVDSARVSVAVADGVWVARGR